MSGAKAALKAAKSALDAQDWDGAVSKAKDVIDSDSKNYYG